MSTRELVFEIQHRDDKGRWRKVAGLPRVHTFGLARLRSKAVKSPDVRVRHVKTGQTWDVREYF